MRREIGQRALVSEEALIRFLSGLRVQSLTRVRIEAALREMDIEISRAVIGTRIASLRTVAAGASSDANTSSPTGGP